MTWKDVFAHFASWRWQVACGVASLNIIICIDWFYSFDSFGAWLSDVGGGVALFVVLANLGWTLFKLCAKYPELFDMILWCLFWTSISND